jgi:CRP-like cAMP-binding protein
LNVLAHASFIFPVGSFETVLSKPRQSKTKGASMNTRTHAANYYRRILSVQPHALKRLDTFAKIMACNRGQEIPNNPGPAGHWYYVINGAVRRCAVRSDGRRQIVDLMLPRDFFVSDSQNEATIEAIAEETVLAIYPGQPVELLAERDAGFARELRDAAFQSFPGHHSAQAHNFAEMRASRSADRYTNPGHSDLTYRMAPLYKDSDSSLWNFRTRTTFIARLIKGCRVDVRADCLISEITQHFQCSNEHFSRPDAFTGVFVLQP